MQPTKEISLKSLYRLTLSTPQGKTCDTKTCLSQYIVSHRRPVCETVKPEHTHVNTGGNQ